MCNLGARRIGTRALSVLTLDEGAGAIPPFGCGAGVASEYRENSFGAADEELPRRLDL